MESSITSFTISDSASLEKVERKLSQCDWKDNTDESIDPRTKLIFCFNDEATTEICFAGSTDYFTNRKDFQLRLNFVVISETWLLKILENKFYYLPQTSFVLILFPANAAFL